MRNAKRYRSMGLIAFALGTIFAAEAAGQITHIDLQIVESPALGGRRFGQIGQYELLRGHAHGEADPDDLQNREIVNLDKAPRNAAGRVEYSTVVEIYRPIDMSHWNRTIYHTVPNRGGSGAGEPTLLDLGFSFVRVGWQGDLAPTKQNIVASLPIATHPDGAPIVGPALEEFIFNDLKPVYRAHLTYPAASLDHGAATLSVRQNQTTTRLTPEDLTWNYLGSKEIEIVHPQGFDGGAIYEFVYQAKNPIVMGLGFAAMRDVISFFRYETTDTIGNVNPLVFEGLPSTALSLGISQSGRFLRDFLYQGFNEDMKGRIVFDGLHPDIAGSRKTFTNYQFSQPGRWQKQHEDHPFPGDQFPFTYAPYTDPISRKTDGLQERCKVSNTCPKIIHTDGETELWQARSSLVVTDSLGKHLDLPENVRVYLIAGTQHGGGPGVHAATPIRGICQNLHNPLALRQIRLALSLALYQWVANGIEPPPSRFPTANNGGLLLANATDFPNVPDITYSGSYNPLHLNNYQFTPPRQGEPYTVLVGRVDADGNMRDGIKHPNLAVPIGTYTGWNLRRKGFAQGEQCGGTGSFIPFATTRVQREVSGDTRLSIEERYPNHEYYVRLVSEVANALVKDRLLLRRDADQIIELAQRSTVGTSH
jgi:hypothetical protein